LYLDSEEYLDKGLCNLFREKGDVSRLYSRMHMLVQFVWPYRLLKVNIII
jgi:hypothetical protein